MTLSEFLLARIAEDRRRASIGLEHGDSSSGTYGAWGHERVLVECEAKRRIVEQYEQARQARDASPDDASRFMPAHAIVMALWPVLVALALPYAEHQDYREEWEL